MPAAVLLRGDQPWLRRLLGISVAPQVRSIFNEAVRDNTAKQWNGIAAGRTTRSDANNHRRYPMTRKSLDAARCTGELPLVIARNRVFLCILHCCMAFGRLFVAFLEAQVGNHPLQVAGEVQKILYRNRCGVRFGAHNAPDGEEAHSLFWARAQIGPLLAYVEEDPPHVASGCGAANIAAHFELDDSGLPRPSCRPVAFAFREHCCGESSSHHLLFLEEDCDAMLESLDACGMGLAAVSGDVVESVNYILKKGCNGHSARGGGAGKSALEHPLLGGLGGVGVGGVFGRGHPDVQLWDEPPHPGQPPQRLLSKACPSRETQTPCRAPPQTPAKQEAPTGAQVLPIGQQLFVGPGTPRPPPCLVSRCMCPTPMVSTRGL